MVRAARGPAAAVAVGVAVEVRGVVVVDGGVVLVVWLRLVDARRRVVGLGCAVLRGRLRRAGASRRAFGGGGVARRRRGRKARFPDR